MLKLYYQDNAWRGSIVAIAETEESARKIMSEKCMNYKADTPIEVYEIENGLCLEDIGDT